MARPGTGVSDATAGQQLIKQAPTGRRRSPPLVNLQLLWHQRQQQQPRHPKQIKPPFPVLYTRLEILEEPGNGARLGVFTHSFKKHHFFPH